MLKERVFVIPLTNIQAASELIQNVFRIIFINFQN